MPRRVVITENIKPPINFRSILPRGVDYDWQATLDNYEPGKPIGHGPSEAFAVYDLFMNIEVHEDVSSKEQTP